VKYIIRIDVGSDNCSLVVEAYGAVRGTACSLGVALAGTGSVEGRKFSVGRTNEAVKHGVRVRIDPRDRPKLIEPCKATRAPRTLARARARAGSFEEGEAAIGMAYQAVLNQVRGVVHVVPHAHSKKIDVRKFAAVTALRSIGFALTGSEKRREFTVGIANEGVE
jgi:hypothetical protein